MARNTSPAAGAKKGPARPSPKGRVNAVRDHIAMLNSSFGGSRPQMMASPRDMESELASARRFCQNRTQNAGRRCTADFNFMLRENAEKKVEEIELASSERFDWRRDKEDRESLKALYAKAYEGNDKQAMQELCAYRQFELEAELLALPFALGLFQEVNLSNDELPMMLYPYAENYFTVKWLGQNGGAHQAQWKNRTRSIEGLELKQLSTPKVEYSLFDFREGDLNQAQSINDRLRYAMEWKIEGEARAALDANTFTSGLRDAVQLDPHIDPDNIPDSNYLDLSDPSYGTPGVLTLIRLKAILNHMALWQANTSPTGPIQMKSMIMSPQNRRDAWDWVDIVTGFDSSAKSWHDDGNLGPGGQDNPQNVVTAQMKDQIFSTGNHISSAWGFNWENQYNSQLGRGRIYITTNKPVGWYFTKTGMDRTITWDNEPDNIEKNQGQTMFTKVLNFFMPDLWACNMLIVDLE